VTQFCWQIKFLWPPYGIGQAIIFLPCGFFLLYGHPAYQIRTLYFCPVSSSFFTLPNLGLADWMSTKLSHVMWSVRISNAGLKYAARCSLEMQDAKDRQKFAIWALSHKFVGLYFRN